MSNTVEISEELYRELLVKQALVSMSGGEECVAALLPAKEKREFIEFKLEVEGGVHDPVKVDY